MGAVKEEAKKLIDGLPEEATWDDIRYELYVKKKLEKALSEAEAGEVVPHETAITEIVGDSASTRGRQH
jgi:predicted transcriptional regulator